MGTPLHVRVSCGVILKTAKPWPHPRPVKSAPLAWGPEGSGSQGSQALVQARSQGRGGGRVAFLPPELTLRLAVRGCDSRGCCDLAAGESHGFGLIFLMKLWGLGAPSLKHAEPYL